MALSRSEIMARIRGKNTSPEMAVRKLVFRMGYRYRLHRRDLPGTPDLVFISLKKIIFTHGCFWHQHGCHLTRSPHSNLKYWVPKLKRNVARDRNAIRELRGLGWRVLVIWECQTKSPSLQARLKRFLEA